MPTAATVAISTATHCSQFTGCCRISIQINASVAIFSPSRLESRDASTSFKVRKKEKFPKIFPATAPAAISAVFRSKIQLKRGNTNASRISPATPCASTA